MWTPLANQYTPVAGDNFDLFLPSPGGSSGIHVPSKGAASVTLAWRKTAKTGTVTVQPFLQEYDPVRAGWIDVPDENDGTAVQGVLHANADALDTTATWRLLTIQQWLPVGHTNGIKTYGTVHKAYQSRIPEMIRVRFRFGGTAVTATIDATLFCHSR